MMVPDRQVNNDASIRIILEFPNSEMFQSLKSVSKYLINSDHHACQTGQLWFPRKRDFGSKVLRSVQTLRGTVIKAGKSRNSVWIRCLLLMFILSFHSYICVNNSRFTTISVCVIFFPFFVHWERTNELDQKIQKVPS